MDVLLCKPSVVSFERRPLCCEDVDEAASESILLKVEQPSKCPVEVVEIKVTTLMLRAIQTTSAEVPPTKSSDRTDPSHVVRIRAVPAPVPMMVLIES